MSLTFNSKGYLITNVRDLNIYIDMPSCTYNIYSHTHITTHIYIHTSITCTIISKLKHIQCTCSFACTNQRTQWMNSETD